MDSIGFMLFCLFVIVEASPVNTHRVTALLLFSFIFNTYSGIPLSKWSQHFFPKYILSPFHSSHNKINFSTVNICTYLLNLTVEHHNLHPQYHHQLNCPRWHQRERGSGEGLTPELPGLKGFTWTMVTCFEHPYLKKVITFFVGALKTFKQQGTWGKISCSQMATENAQAVAYPEFLRRGGGANPKSLFTNLLFWPFFF